MLTKKELDFINWKQEVEIDKINYNWNKNYQRKLKSTIKKKVLKALPELELVKKTFPEWFQK